MPKTILIFILCGAFGNIKTVRAWIQCNYTKDDYESFNLDYKFPSYNNTEKVDFLWLIFASLVLVGNFSVLLWRLTRSSEQRGSIPSILVINLSLSDFLLGVQMLVYFFLESCTVFGNETKTTATCRLSAFLQITSVAMSGFVTSTIALYYVTVVFSCRCSSCLGRPLCSRMKIACLLFLEWALAAGLSVAMAFDTPFYSTYINDDIGNEYVFGSSVCLPMLDKTPWFSITFMLINLFLLSSAAVAYVCILVKTRRQRTTDSTLSGLGIRLAAIAFLSLVCYAGVYTIEGLSVTKESDLPMPVGFVTESVYYSALLILSVVAIFNPLVFTFSSKPFLEFVRTTWIQLRFKCGTGVSLADILAYEDDDRAPLITDVPDSDSDTRSGFLQV